MAHVLCAIRYDARSSRRARLRSVSASEDPVGGGVRESRVAGVTGPCQCSRWFERPNTVDANGHVPVVLGAVRCRIALSLRGSKWLTATFNFYNLIGAFRMRLDMAVGLQVLSD